MESDANTTTSSTESKKFEFTGKAGEYFSIWIVNVLLTILTLGIYSAWAKVRTNQYFYGNTRLNGNTFRYLADPKQILKGRAIAVACFALYYFSGLISPMAAVASLLLLVILMPALIVMSMSFQLRNTAYRNIRFKFEKNFKKAYMVFILPMLILGPYFIFITVFKPEELVTQQEIPKYMIFMMAGFPFLIMLLFPWWEYMITRFKVSHSNFGTSDFAFGAKKRQYYFLYLKPFLGIMLVGILAAIIIPAIADYTQAADAAQAANTTQPAGEVQSANSQSTATNPIVVIAVPFAIILFYLWFFAYLQARRTNLIFNNISIEGHQLKSNLGVGYMMYLYATNTLAMALSLGLLMPWAKIRTARYKANMTTVMPSGDFDGFISAQAEQQSALGEEMGEIFDLDLGM